MSSNLIAHGIFGLADAILSLGAVAFLGVAVDASYKYKSYPLQAKELEQKEKMAELNQEDLRDIRKALLEKPSMKNK